MEKYQDLKIMFHEKIETNTIIQLFNEQAKKGKWKVRSDMSELAMKNMLLDSKDKKSIMCIESPKFKLEGKDIDGIVWMWVSNDSLEVFNIISNTLSHLSCAQYNRILLRFEEKIVNPLGKEHKFTIVKSKAVFDIKDYIGEDGFNLLSLFSNYSNKSTGHSHPMDFARWCDFIFYVQKNKCQLSSIDFQNWLIENGWNEEMSQKLAIDYEYSLDLLNRYE